MKTAEQILEEHTGHAYRLTSINHIHAMEEYAKQVAEQALKDAAENAIYITVGDEISIVKSSITNTKIELR